MIIPNGIKFRQIIFYIDFILYDWAFCYSKFRQALICKSAEAK